MPYAFACAKIKSIAHGGQGVDLESLQTDYMSFSQLYNTLLSNHQFLLIQLVEMGNFYRRAGNLFFCKDIPSGND